MIELSTGTKYYTEKEYNNLRDDFNLLSEALREEAEDRDWCDDYNVFVEQVNDKLKVMHLELLEKEYSVEVTFTCKQTVSTSIVVTASTKKDAERIVSDMSYDEALTDANVTDWEWESEEEDFEITDVVDN